MNTEIRALTASEIDFVAGAASSTSFAGAGALIGLSYASAGTSAYSGGRQGGSTSGGATAVAVGILPIAVAGSTSHA
jgi:hypothetical protein